MSAELGAQTGLIAPDATTMAWLAEAGCPPPRSTPSRLRTGSTGAWSRRAGQPPLRRGRAWSRRWPRRIRRPTPALSARLPDSPWTSPTRRLHRRQTWKTCAMAARRAAWPAGAWRPA
ncbi:hypothetical protein ACU4GD_03525 [Cupriavidus basilensis]